MSELEDFGAHMRSCVEQWISGSEIPRPVFHMCRRDYGLSSPSLASRSNTMVIRTTIQLKKIFQAFVNEERDIRLLARQGERNVPAGSLTWPFT
jgi:hypothetical protein